MISTNDALKLQNIIDQSSRYATMSEYPSSVIFSELVLDRTLYDEWARLRDRHQDAGVVEIAGQTGSRAPLFEPREDDEFPLTGVHLTVNSKFGVPCFFTIAGFDSWLTRELEWPVDDGVILVRADSAVIEMRTGRIESIGAPETDYALLDSPKWASPRKICRDLAANRIVPERLEAWVPIDHGSDSLIRSTLCNVASQRMFACLGARAWTESSAIVVSVTGATTVDRTAPLKVNRRDFEQLSKVIEWLFSEERDAFVRHNFLQGALARVWEWSSADPFAAATLQHAMEEAMTAYALHLKENGEKTIRVLTDLRKSIADDATKISLQARDLVSSLWRDMIVVLTAVSARVIFAFSDSAAKHSTSVEVGLYIAALLIAASGISTIAVNNKFLALQASNLSKWRLDLYSFVSDAQWKRLASDQISEAKSAYVVARTAVITIYFLGVVATVYTGITVRTARDRSTRRGNEVVFPQ